MQCNRYTSVGSLEKERVYYLEIFAGGIISEKQNKKWFFSCIY
jgi:hypothetical protein